MEARRLIYAVRREFVMARRRMGLAARLVEREDNAAYAAWLNRSIEEYGVAGTVDRQIQHSQNIAARVFGNIDFRKDSLSRD